VSTVTASAALHASEVSVHIGAHRILERLNLDTTFGEFFGVIGPNGAGKSTLLRALASLLPADAGAIFVDGAALHARSPRELARLMAYVPQNTWMDFSFTVRDVVLMGRHPHLARFAAEGDRDRLVAQHAMSDAGVHQLAHRALPTLSGGERQLVWIAKALAQEPRVLLLDEPVAALDLRHQLDVLELIRRHVDGGIAAVAVLHDLNLAARFCDRLALMTGGRVVAVGTPAEVLTEEALCRAYRVRANVGVDPATGAVLVTPLSAVEAS
jgi:iron complex transport system ATP-binding protein